MADEVRWFVGIDWASEQHQVCLLDANGHVVGERVFAHGGEGLAGLCAWLVATREHAREQRQSKPVMTSNPIHHHIILKPSLPI